MPAPATSGQLRTRIQDMVIGDYIKCKYQASSQTFGVFSELGTTAAPELPVIAGSTPTGFFYFIMVGTDRKGRKKLIADRNIQTNITWDTLLNAGIATYTGKAYPEPRRDLKATPNMAAASQGGYQVIRSSVYNGSYEGFYAFSGAPNDSSWLSANGSNTNQYVGIILPSAMEFTRVRIAQYLSSGSYNVKNFRIEASNDGALWDTILTGVLPFNGGGAFPATYNTYVWPRVGKTYTHWRVFCIDGHAGTTALGLNEVEFYESTNPISDSLEQVYIRMINGGVGDTDNEWDQTIVNSTLGGKITAGDDNVWHWNNGVYSWVLNAGVGSNRKIRGAAGSISFRNDFASNTLRSDFGWRPVLIAESAVVVQANVLKYLFQDESAIKKFTGGVWSDVGAAPATEAMFVSNGMTDLSAINNAALQQLNNPSLLVYKSGNVAAPTVTATCVPPAKLMLASGNIVLSEYTESVDFFRITATVSGTGVLKMIASADSGVTWKAWDGAQWVTVNTADMVDVNAKAMTVATFNAVTPAAWNSLILATKTVRFGYYLDMAASTDQAKSDKLEMQLDMKGTWKIAIHGTDYDYEYFNNTTLRVNLTSNGDFKINY